VHTGATTRTGPKEEEEEKKKKEAANLRMGN
jgi:hypothetical protein